MKSRILSTFAVLAALLAPTVNVASAEALRAFPTPPPVLRAFSDVPAVLSAVQPQVEQCGRSSPPPSARVQVNVVAFPDGQWSVTFGSPRGTPPPGARGSNAFENCIASVIASELGSQLQPFRGGRPHKVSHRYAFATAIPQVTPTAPTVGPLSASQLAVVRRVLATRRAALQDCVPHAAPPRPTRQPVRMRVEIDASGRLRLTGIELPEHVDFATTAACFERAVDGVAGLATGGTYRGEVTVQLAISAPVPPGDVQHCDPPDERGARRCTTGE